MAYKIFNVTVDKQTKGHLCKFKINHIFFFLTKINHIFNQYKYLSFTLQHLPKLFVNFILKSPLLPLNSFFIYPQQKFPDQIVIKQVNVFFFFFFFFFSSSSVFTSSVSQRLQRNSLWILSLSLSLKILFFFSLSLS